MNGELAALGVVAFGAASVVWYLRWLDIDTLARTIWGEARGEDYRGRVAVANVVMNRVASDRWPNTVRGVCRQPYQFSAWNDYDPNRELVEAVSTDDAVFVECLAIARAAVSGNLADVTAGANHYFARRIATPSWARDMQLVADIGAHRFYRG